MDPIIVPVAKAGLRDYYKSHSLSLSRLFVCFLPAYFLNTAWKTSAFELSRGLSELHVRVEMFLESGKRVRIAD